MTFIKGQQNNPGRKFPKGVSGNPGGRPKGWGEIAKLAQSHGPEMIEVLLAIARDTTAPHSARTAAAIALLDRGFGRPPQALHHSGEDGGPVQVQHNVDIFINQLRQLRRRIEETELEPRPN